MLMLKCEKCGGDVEVDEALNIGKCIYCDSTMIIPKNAEKIANLYNRAVFLRQSNRFDDAIQEYEKILEENNDESEAHFGLLLSRYGIEYVEDPKTGERIPTCHRTKEESILADADYLKALECADLYAQDYYRQEAERINEIQQKILEIARNEEPYDVFICYKEVDSLGNRTEDSVLAQDIYERLTKDNYRVFFARKTLEEKLGKEYEPLIFGALNSAKVLIVVGCSPENCNAIWVKNEWSRFLEIRKEKPDRVIIPCYKGFSPYDLPRELTCFQAQDMGKIGFVQDIADGVNRILTEKIEKKSSGIVNTVEKLVKNAKTFISLGRQSDALEIYTSLTKNEPDDYRGWWGVASIYSNEFTTYPVANLATIKECGQNALKVAKGAAKEQIEEVWQAYLNEEIRLQKEEKKRLHEQAVEKEKRDIQERLVALNNKVNNYLKVENEKMKEMHRLRNAIKEKENGMKGLEEIVLKGAPDYSKKVVKVLLGIAGVAILIGLFDVRGVFDFFALIFVVGIMFGIAYFIVVAIVVNGINKVQGKKYDADAKRLQQAQKEKNDLCARLYELENEQKQYQDNKKEIEKLSQRLNKLTY